MPVQYPDPSGTVVGSLTPDELATIAAAQDAWADIYAHNKTLANQIKAEAGKFKWTPRMRLLIAQARKISAADADALTKLYSNPTLVKKYAAAVLKGISKGIGTTLATGAAKAGQGAVALGPAIAHATNPIAGLFQASIWLRVAEVGLGLLLVAVGVAKLTNAIPAATKIAGAVSKMPV